MILRLDGRPIDADLRGRLLDALLLDDLAVTLARDGWQPTPSRIQRRPRNGRLVIRLTWTRHLDGGCQVMRVTHVATAIEAP